MFSKKSLIPNLVILCMLLVGLFGRGAVKPAQAATSVVTNANDSGAGSLRQAILDAAPGDTINFDPSLAGQTIVLVPQISLDKDLIIDGSGLSPAVEISGGLVSRIFHVSNSTLTLRSLTLKDGRDDVGTNGGAIHNEGSLIVRNSTFINNISVGRGGAIYNRSALDIDSSTFVNNSASSGGAIYLEGDIFTNSDSSRRIVNSTFVSNEANPINGQGGGIYNYNEALYPGENVPVLANNTFSGNGAYRGGGLFNWGTLSFNNNIFADSMSGGDCVNFALSGMVTGWNNLFEDGKPCSPDPFVSGDPLLGPLSDNGGFTQTMALLPGSPAIDGGTDTCVPIDQRGISRPQGNACDIGAYEVRTWVVTNTDDFAVGSLRQSILSAGPGDRIIFSSSLAGQTITLAGDLIIYRYLTIDGSGLSPMVTISGGNAFHLEIKAWVDVTISDLIIANGNTAGAGGAIESAGNLTIVNSTLRNNHAELYGGAIDMRGNGSLVLKNSTLYQNQTPGAGGAIALAGNGTNTIANSTIYQNQAGEGGAIYSNANLTLSNTTLRNNIAGGDGGAISSSAYQLTLKDSAIYQNQAGNVGGAVAIAGNGSTTIANSTINENQAADGGSIFVLGNPIVNMFNSTSAGNNASGGASELSLIGSGSLNLFNTIFACTPVNGTCISQSLTFNISDVNSSIGIGTLADFGLAPLGEYGGPTKTMALFPNSLLVDAGNDSICANEFINNKDQRGVTRPRGAHCDIGAYEADESFVPTPTATPTFTPTNTPTATQTPTPTSTPPYSYQPLYLSLTGSQTIGGVSSADEDISKFDGMNWSLFFDGSDVGVGSLDLVAFSIIDADTILMSFSASVTVQGISATPQDVLRFDATSLGSATAGTFSMYFDGSDVGFDTTAEKIDALTLLPDGRLLVSTTGSASVPGLTTGRDEDVLVFTPASLGATTSGTWSMYFDGSDVGLSEASGEDVDALDVASGKVYLSTLDNFSVNGLTGTDEDVFVCTPTSLGATTSCNYSPALYFDGSTWGLAANDVDAINLLATGPVPTAVPTSTPTATQALTPTPTSPMGVFDVRILSHEPSPSNIGEAITVTVSVTDVGGGPAGSVFVNVVSDEGSTSCTTSQITDTCSAQLTFNNPFGHLIRASVGADFAEVDHYVNPPSTPTFTPTATSTPTNTPNGSDLIFADGFETGNLSTWSSSSIDAGDLSVSLAAALIGGQGLQAVIDDANVLSVTSDHPAAESRYRARFYFDPNSISMASGDAHIILRGYSGSSTVALRVEFGYAASGYQIRAGLVNDGTTFAETSWFPLSDAPHSIELDWRAATGAGANDGGLTLWIDGVECQTLTGIDNDTRRMDRVLLGALAGIDTGTRGTYHFDAFESRRQTYIGP